MSNKILKELNLEREYSLIVKRRDTWCFQVMVNVSDKPYCDQEKLISNNGELTKAVKDFMHKIEGYSDNDWTLAYFKYLVAFKNPADRVIYVYNKKYFKDRFILSGDNSIFKCKSIRFD